MARLPAVDLGRQGRHEMTRVHSTRRGESLTKGTLSGTQTGLAKGRPRLMIHDNREGPLPRVINEEGVATCYSLGAESQRPGLFLARGKP
jgi:hypothetical protein